MTKTTAIPLSCYIRTLNEERMIGDVIRAAYKVVDEVIVIDSGSTDRTREIVLEQGARIIDQPWLGNGFQKRIGEEACRHDWILDLDADEIVTDELASEIRALFENGRKPEHSIYEMPLITIPPVGKAWYNAYERLHTKLYDKSALRIPAHKAWDHFKIPTDMQVGRLRASLFHHSFTDLGHLVRKYNTWSGFRAQNTKQKPVPILIFRLLFAFPFYFVKMYLLRGLWKVGFYGFMCAVIGAFGSWLGNAKMLERHMMKKERARSSKESD